MVQNSAKGCKVVNFGAQWVQRCLWLRQQTTERKKKDGCATSQAYCSAAHYTAVLAAPSNLAVMLHLSHAKSYCSSTCRLVHTLYDISADLTGDHT